MVYASIMHSEQRRHRSWILFTLLQTNGWIGKPIPRYRLHVFSCAKLHAHLIWDACMHLSHKKTTLWCFPCPIVSTKSTQYGSNYLLLWGGVLYWVWFVICFKILSIKAGLRPIHTKDSLNNHSNSMKIWKFFTTTIMITSQRNDWYHFQNFLFFSQMMKNKNIDSQIESILPYPLNSLSI